MSMTVVMLEPGKKARIVEIEKDLESMQKIVGGLVQFTFPFGDEVVLVCNDEGKMIGLPPNRGLYDSDGKLYDILCGTVFICGAPLDSDNVESLSEEQIKKYYELFEKPEWFHFNNDSITVIKHIPEQSEER